MVAFLFLLLTSNKADTVDELLQQTQAALKKGDLKAALESAEKAVQADARSVKAVFLRGVVHDQTQKHKEAIADFTAALQLDPKYADAYNQRGNAHFKSGKLKESLADFDKYLELEPRRAREHWQRGITCFYVGRYDEGRKQFEAYQNFDNADVENAVWRYLCMAKDGGVEKAQKDILKIGIDRRAVMTEVYALYAGKAKPDEVLKAAEAGKPDKVELNSRLFYAHLYLGLYFDVHGDARKAKEHMAEAVKYKIGHYMWDVANVHNQVFKGELKP